MIMRYSNTSNRTVRALGARALALAFAALAAVAGTRPADAATETITVARNVGSSVYFVSSDPSAASRCNLDDRLHPVTATALRTFKRVLDSQGPLINVIEFTCKAEIYAGEPGSCSVFKLTGCQCSAGCLQLGF
jgi:hypothetical protein